MHVVFISNHFQTGLFLTVAACERLLCVFAAASEDPLSPPSQRSRAHDTSAELQPMPTSPAMDTSAQDVSLFSSPMAPRSGAARIQHLTCTEPELFMQLMWIRKTSRCVSSSPAERDRRELSADVRHPQLQGGRNAPQRHTRDPGTSAGRPGICPESSTGRPAFRTGEWK